MCANIYVKTLVCGGLQPDIYALQNVFHFYSIQENHKVCFLCSKTSFNPVVFPQTFFFYSFVAMPSNLFLLLF